MMLGRRRPLMRAAMVGGAGYMVGKRRAQSQEQQQEQEQSQQAQEQSQDDRISNLEQQQPAQPAAPAEAGGPDVVAKLQQLSQLHDSGSLNDEQFEAAKRDLLGA